MTDPDPRAAEAYQLYVVQHMSLEAIEAKLHTSRRRLKRWIIERGGEIRGHGGNHHPRTTQTAPGKTGWRKEEMVVCFIGRAKGYSFSDGGSWFCAGYCHWTDCRSPQLCAEYDAARHMCMYKHKSRCKWYSDMCRESVTIANLWAYAKLVTERVRKHRGDEERTRRWHEIMMAHIRLRESH